MDDKCNSGHGIFSQELYTSRLEWPVQARSFDVNPQPAVPLLFSALASFRHIIINCFGIANPFSF